MAVLLAFPEKAQGLEPKALFQKVIAAGQQAAGTDLCRRLPPETQVQSISRLFPFLKIRVVLVRPLPSISLVLRSCDRGSWGVRWNLGCELRAGGVALPDAACLFSLRCRPSRACMRCCTFRADP